MRSTTPKTSMPPHKLIQVSGALSLDLIILLLWILLLGIVPRKEKREKEAKR